MLPGGVLGRKQLTKLKIYSGVIILIQHKILNLLDLGKLNSKNLVRN